MAALGSTVAVTAALAVAWKLQRHTTQQLPARQDDDDEDHDQREVPPTQDVTLTIHKPATDNNNEDAVSLTDSNSSTTSTNGGEEEAETEQEETPTTPPAAKKTDVVHPMMDFQTLGWDADEVPELVRVVESIAAVQYTGPIGGTTGSTGRSVRAANPLPKPGKFRKVTQTHVPAKTVQKNKTRKAKAPTVTVRFVPEPFVQSYKLADGSVNTTARCVSYFEVNLVTGPKVDHEEKEESNDADINNNTVNNATPAVPCIAVGMSLHAFDWQHALPGWDELSFGYHGDDGTARFGGRVEEAKGPTFGQIAADDTVVVGCGIDYDRQRVFYTLHGEFLGYTDTVLDTTKHLTREWIPTVGLDATHVAVQYNVAGPFAFDVASLQDPKVTTTPNNHKTTTTSK
eukprot:scaffold1513_cov100-Amphora_coffeaeformis.AAC.13